MLSLASSQIMAQCNFSEYASHEVAPGETVFAIAQKYSISVDQLIICNDSIAGDYVISPGQVLQVPIVDQVDPEDLLEIDKYVYHKVEQGQTLYSISKMYPNTTLEAILEMNEMEELVLSIGQYLIVGEINSEAIFEGKPKRKRKKNQQEEVETEVITVEVDTLKTLEDSTIPVEIVEVDSSNIETEEIDQAEIYAGMYADLSSSGRAEQFSKGVANYLDGTEEEPLVILCNTVPIGSVVKIKNLINNKITYAKVIGRLPGTEDDNILVKLSYSTARRLNVLDRKVLIELSYLQ